MMNPVGPNGGLSVEEGKLRGRCMLLWCIARYSPPGQHVFSEWATEERSLWHMLDSILVPQWIRYTLCVVMPNHLLQVHSICVDVLGSIKRYWEVDGRRSVQKT